MKELLEQLLASGEITQSAYDQLTQAKTQDDGGPHPGQQPPPPPPPPKS